MTLALLRARKRILSSEPIVPSVGLSLSSSALTVEQNGSVTITVFATRSGGFTGTITPSVAGLPSGLTPFFFPATLGAADSSCQLTLTASENATAVTNDAFTVSLASSLGTQTANATVTITNAATSGEIPIVSSVTPSSGAPDQTRAVTISGLNFITGATVDVGNGSTWTAATSVVRVNDTTITATLPALALGTYSVRVTTAEGVGLLTNGVSYGAVPFFEDEFSNGQVNPANGFAYLDLKKSEVVLASGEGLANTDGATYLLRSRYDGYVNGAPAPEGRNPEVRVAFGRDVNELAVEWRVLFPPTYGHRDDDTLSTNNRKFMIAWGGGYSSGTHQVGCEMERGVAPQISRTRSLIRFSQAQNGSVPGLYMRVAAGETQTLVSPTGPITPGVWATVRWYVKKESSYRAGDGIWRLWVDGVLIRNFTGLFMGASDPLLWDVALQFMYFLGAHNAGHDTNVAFYTRRLRFFDTDPGWF